MLVELIRFFTAPKANSATPIDLPREVHGRARSSVPWSTIVIWKDPSRSLPEEVDIAFKCRGITNANAFSIEEAGDGKLSAFGGKNTAVIIRPKLVGSYFKK